MRGAAGLVEALDRHPMLPPPRHRARVPDLARTAVAAVEGAVDHVAVRALDVLGALHQPGDDRLVLEAFGHRPDPRQLSIRLAQRARPSLARPRAVARPGR